MCRKLLLAFASLFLLSAFLVAQDGKLRGRVTDKESGEPLIGANVLIEGTSLGASSDVNGDYVILGVPPGLFSVKASYIGYASVTISNLRVSANLTTNQNFQLSSTAIQVQAVEVVAERPLIQRNTTNTIRQTTQEDVKYLPFRGVQNILALNAGVVQQNGVLYVRGGRSGEIAYFVDGATATNPFFNSEAVSIIQEAIEEIQLQAGGYTAEFGGANSGIARTTVRTGGSDLRFTVDYQTDDFAKPGKEFLGTTSTGYRNAVVTVGGPLMSNLRFFVAGQHNYQRSRDVMFLEPFKIEGLVTDGLGSRPTGTKLPGPVEFKRNYLYNNWNSANSVQGTLLYDLNPVKLRFTGSYSQSVSPSGGQWPGALQFYYNQGKNTERTTNSAFGNLRATHILGPTTFYEVGVSYYNRKFKSYDTEFKDDWQKYVDSTFNQNRGWVGKYEGPFPYSTIFGFNFNHENAPNNSYSKNDQSSVGATFDFTSQLDKRWELKAGGRLESWVIRNWGIGNISNYLIFLNGRDGKTARTFANDNERRARLGRAGSINFYGYDVNGNSVDSGPDAPGKPLFASAYLQNKFEYEDLILNIGARFEYFSPKARKPENIENPTIDETINLIDEKTLIETEPFQYLLPRVSFSFPVTDRTVFYAQYGKYVQMPSLNQLYAGLVQLSNIVSPTTRSPYGYFTRDGLSQFAGFTMRPERTTTYEMGIRQGLTDNFAFTLSGFYRDLRDQIQPGRIFSDRGTILFSGWVNEDFGTVKGLEMTFELRRTNRIAARVNYTLSDARGTGSTANTSRVVVSDVSTRYPNFISALDYNQGHRGSVLIDYRFAKGDGGPVLEGTGLNVLLTFNSGHPYTKIAEPQNLGQSNAWNVGVRMMADPRFRNPVEPINASSTPWVFNVDLNLSKQLYFANLVTEVYVNVLNVFNSRQVINVYTSTGTPQDDGWLKSPFAVPYKEIPRYVEFYNAINTLNRWAYISQTGLDVYGQPRQVRLGAKVEF